MNYTQSIGNVNELKCISRFMELGYECSIPYGNGAKYDFIADVDGKLIKIQCKSCSHPRKNGIIDENAIQISTIAQTTNAQKTTRHTYNKDQIDFFATSYKDKIYIIPAEECSTSKTLRFQSPQNNNQAYNKAEDYEIEKRFSQSNDLIQSKKEYDERINNISIEEKQFFCKQCGTKISDSKTGLCSKCYALTTRKCKRPSREELKNMIRILPFTKIGEKFNVSDNAVRKWCDAEKLPRKSSEIRSYSDEEWSKI